MKDHSQVQVRDSNNNYPQNFRLSPLIHSIKNLLALGVVISSSSAFATDSLVNHNEIWLNPNRGELKGICVKDIDQDNDLDILKIFNTEIALLENIGSPTSPEYALSKPYVSKLRHQNIKSLGLDNCLIYKQALIDIDADGDLDLFKGSSNKSGTRLNFSRNHGTSENPDYIVENLFENFQLPDNTRNFMFIDIDGDGDLDFFGGPDYKTSFFENIGTPENASFIHRDNSPIESACQQSNFSEYMGFLIDLNGDNQFDMLCPNSDNNLSYFESIDGSFSVETKLYKSGYYGNITNVITFDINNDGKKDIIGQSLNKNNDIVQYTNIGSDTEPKFDRGQIYATIPIENQAISDVVYSDLDDDGDLDIIFYSALGSFNFPISTPFRNNRIEYIINTGSNTNPIYNIANLTHVFEQCNNSFLDFGQDYHLYDIALVDIDGDNDLDLFAQLNTSPSNLIDQNLPHTTIYCENQGSASNPVYPSGIEKPFGLDFPSSNLNIFDSLLPLHFGDIDGDGDQDLLKSNIYYENIGTSTQPLFQRTKAIVNEGKDSFGTKESFSLDIDGDGQIESLLLSSRFKLIYKGLDPVTNIAVSPSFYQNDLIIATSTSSHVQLRRCGQSTAISKTCQSIILPDVAKEISVTVAKSINHEASILLAMVDNNDLAKIKIFNINLELIASYTAGTARSISIISGQLDNDPEDEGVVSFIQDDGRAVAVSFNIDGSIIGTVVTNQAKQVSIAMGQFKDNTKGFIVASLTPDNLIETATYTGNGTLIGQGSGGGEANYISVNSANILGSSLDEYIISLTQPNDVAGLIGFDSEGRLIGKVTGSVLSRPKTLAGKLLQSTTSGENFFFAKPGLAVSSILPNQRPAISFLNNQGQHIVTEIGETTASQATLAISDVNDDSIDEAILVYIDKAGLLRLEIFNANGHLFVD